MLGSAQSNATAYSLANCGLAEILPTSKSKSANAILSITGIVLDSSPLPAVSAPLAAGNAQPVMASRGCWRWDSPTLARVCVRWDWSVRWSSPTARPGACPFGPPLSYQIAWDESVFHAGRERPP